MQVQNGDACAFLGTILQNRAIFLWNKRGRVLHNMDCAKYRAKLLRSGGKSCEK